MEIVFVILTGLDMIARFEDAIMIVLVMELANKFLQNLEFKGAVHAKQDILVILALSGRAQMIVQISVPAQTEHAFVIKALVVMTALSLRNR
jgi:hypothetical protein